MEHSMLRILFVLFCLTSSTFAQTFAGRGATPAELIPLNDSLSFSGGTIDQIMEYTNSGALSNCNITGTTLILVGFGQSLQGNQAGVTPYTATNPTAVTFNPYDYNCYAAVDPLAGQWVTSGGSYLTRVADTLVTNAVFSKVIIMPFAVGSSTVLDWSPSGNINQRVKFACATVRRLGWTTNSNVKIAVLWDQGQGDVATSQADYISRWNYMQASWLNNGCNTQPWFVAIDTMGGFSVNATIQAAQAALVNGVTVFTGANIDSLGTGANRNADGVHLTTAGVAAAAALWVSIFTAHPW